MARGPRGIGGGALGGRTRSAVMLPTPADAFALTSNRAAVVQSGRPSTFSVDGNARAIRTRTGMPVAVKLPSGLAGRGTLEGPVLVFSLIETTSNVGVCDVS